MAFRNRQNQKKSHSTDKWWKIGSGHEQAGHNSSGLPSNFLIQNVFLPNNFKLQFDSFSPAMPTSENNSFPFFWRSLHLLRKGVLKQFWKLSFVTSEKGTSAFYQMAIADSDHLVCVPLPNMWKVQWSVRFSRQQKNQAFVQEAKIRGSKIMLCREL